MLLRTLLISILLFTLILPIVQSTAPYIDSTVSDQITIQHGQTKPITVYVTNHEQYCKVTCYFTVTPDSINVSIGQIETGNQGSAQYYIPAPAKSINTDTKQITIFCSKVRSLLCLIPDTSVRSIPGTVSITYTLTDEEQSAKDYVNSQIQSISPLVKELDTNIQTAQSKLNGLSTNVKRADLLSASNTLSATFSPIKSNFANVQSLYDNQDYILAKTSYSTISLQSLQSIKPNVDKLLIDIDARIALHNQLAQAITNITQKLNQYNELATVSGSQKEYTTISDNVSILVQNFNSGNFDTYDNVQNNVQELNSVIDKSATKWQQKLQDTISTAESVLNNEYSKLCKLKQYCNVTTYHFEISSTGLNIACNAIKHNLINDFNLANDKALKEYQLMLGGGEQWKAYLQQENERIKQTNDEIKSYNSGLGNTNSIIKELSSVVNKYRLNATTFTECRQLINSTNSATDIKERSTLTAKVVSSCTADLEDAKKQANLKNDLFSKIIQLFSFLRPDVSHLNKITPFDEQPLKDVNNETIQQPTDIEPEQKTNDFATTACNLNLQTAKNEFITPGLESSKNPIITNAIDTSLKEATRQCTLFGQSVSCCTGPSCKSNPSLYPIIFVHGFQAYLGSGMDALDSFKDFQNKLQEQGYVSESFILPNNLDSNNSYDWSSFGRPITVRTTYYVDAYDANGRLVGPQTSESINKYAEHLSKVVDEVLRRTGKDKVILISHSMGGLVSRAYIENLGGQDKVYKLITLGTPNYGVLANQTNTFFNTAGVCAFISNRQECVDMKEGSNFLTSLNSINIPSSIKIMTVAVNGTSNTDGLIAVSSVALPYAENYVIQNYFDKCPVSNGLSGFLGPSCHSIMLQPKTIPEAYGYVVDFLKK